MALLRDSIGKTTLRALGEFCGSAVIDLSQDTAETQSTQEFTLRKTIIPTDSLTEGVALLTEGGRINHKFNTEVETQGEAVVGECWSS